MSRIVKVMVGAAVFVAAGCGSENDMMMGPGGPAAAAPTLMSVSPAGGMTGVPVGTPLEVHWGTAMAAGMEEYVDLHRGDLSGPVVPMSFAWSADRTTLVCTPASPLQPGVQYTLHVGGGMVDADGHPVDMDEHGPGFGGHWIQGGMMGGGHGGTPWGMMGSHWRHADGSYGMVFSFTTAT